MTDKIIQFSQSELSRNSLSQGRIESLDLIRGVAILGILIMNVFAMATPVIAYTVPQWSYASIPADTVVYILQSILIESRFMSMFAMLFGVGLALQRRKLEERGEKYRPYLMRRLFWLLIFGLAHGFLLWAGDILTNYALAGFFVIAAVKWKPRRLITVGIILILLGQIAPLLGFWGSLVTGDNIMQVPDLPFNEAMVALQRQEWTNLLSRFSANVKVFGDFLLFIPITTFWNSMGLMMIGAALYQLNFFSNRRIWRTGILFFLIGLGGGIAVLWLRFAVGIETSAGQSLTPLMFLPGAFSGIAYMSFMVPLARGSSLLVRSLRNTGKTAFTLYIGQTVITLFVFVVLLRQWWGSYSRPILLLYVLVFSIFQVVFAHYWQSKRGQGPLESIWRRLCKGKAKSTS